MPDLAELRSPENLRRAWRWIRSNPDASFKSYFRNLYQHYAVAEDALLDDLADRLRRGIYEPQNACKLFHPKSSGILRPYTLLTVEDQIVYQAAINLVAERLLPRVSHRYYKQVFGHLYAGTNSTWFYRKWSDGYKAFNDGARDAFAKGFIFAASFDLTACYDSLDHGVLKHFMVKQGHDLDFSNKVVEWLGKWTATEHGIFHSHGIPQGPLSSGLLSEVVLSHFDTLKLRGVDFHYFRYVDDIRLFAKSENDLRRLLVGLDLLSKDIGLFPQSGKIGIHQVQNIEDELKSVSNPPEASVQRTTIDQKRLLKRIVQLTPRYRVTNGTRFKFLVAHADPCAALTQRLWRIFEKHPEHYRSVCNYLRRYRTIPLVPAKKLVEQIKTNTLYQAVRAEFISVADGRLPLAQDAALARHLKAFWTPRSLHPDLLARIGHYLIRTGHLSMRQIIYACAHARSWWTRATLIEDLEASSIGKASLGAIVDSGIQDKASDVAIVAAWKAFSDRRVPVAARRDWNVVGEVLLKDVGMIQRARGRHCGINKSFSKLDTRIPNLRWKRLFEARYNQAELQAVEMVAASGVNITGFVNLLDVFNDLLLAAFFPLDGTIGGYTLGQIGSALNDRSRFAAKFPATFALVKRVHQARYESMYSHPVIRSTGRPTRKISYKFLGTSKNLIRAAFAELSSHGIA